ncbi:hypothetical protein ACA910_015370 [Epithemia clementina (nom. ined.)]
MARLLHVNYDHQHRDRDVPWSKLNQAPPIDALVHAKESKENDNNNYILTVVLVRDPLRWMQKLVCIAKRHTMLSGSVMTRFVIIVPVESDRRIITTITTTRIRRRHP